MSHEESDYLTCTCACVGQTNITLIHACVSAVQWCPVLPHLAEMEYLLLQTSTDRSESGASNIQNVSNFTYNVSFSSICYATSHLCFMELTSVKCPSLNPFLFSVSWLQSQYCVIFNLYNILCRCVEKSCDQSLKTAKNRNLHISKIQYLLPVCLTNSRRRMDYISNLHAQLGENQ